MTLLQLTGKTFSLVEIKICEAYIFRLPSFFTISGMLNTGTEFNFLKATATLTYNVTYDYGSLMHYSRYSFAADPSIPTITPNDPEAEIGQRRGLSGKDIYKVNAMYCPENNGDIPLP
jgi:hypothetical protein